MTSFRKCSTRARLLFCPTIVLLLAFTDSAWPQDPQGTQDSFYLECGAVPGQALLLELRFSSDNTDSNRIAAFGLPVLITVTNNALILLDTTVATTFSGSMVERFAFLSTATDSTGGADPAQSPVHFVLGAVSFDSGATGQGLFANLKLTLNGDSTTVTVDTLSTSRASPQLVTEKAQAYTPGWKPGGFTCVTTAVRDLDKSQGSHLPSKFDLSQNYPNPFNASTLIEFQLPVAAHAKLELFNLLGQRMKVLVDQQLSPGYKQVRWDGTDQTGQHVASGVYFYKWQVSNKFVAVKKMVFLR